MTAASGKWSEALSWAFLAFLLTVGLPLFVCMPLWLDVSLYDLAARNLGRGGIHYRDVFDTNLPGMVWLHLGVRRLFGWRSESMRLVDVAFLTAIIGLLVRGLRPLGLTRSARLWAAGGLYAFYLSTSEWVHCQRDVWMLLPVLAALDLRRRQVTDLLENPQPPRPRAAVRAAVEGLCWGGAFWIKPFVAVPALACGLFTQAYLRRPKARAGRLALLNEAFVLTGASLAVGLGVVWLWSSGTWPHFCDVVLNWNPDYYSTTEGHLLLRAVYPLLLFSPWGSIHLLALPIAMAAICRALQAPCRPGPCLAPTSRWPMGLLGACYLGWFLQASFLQTAFDYVQAPAVLLALTLVAGQVWLSGRSWAVRGLLAVFVVLAAARHPLLQWERTALWVRCWREGSTAELRDRLTLIGRPPIAGWNDLQQVAVFLRGLHLRDGELTCFNNSTHVLYLQSGLQPSTRFLHFDTVLQRFPHHWEAVRQELDASAQRFVVSDLRGVGLDTVQVAATCPERPLALPPDFPRDRAALFPWCEPIIFRSGRFLVHRVTGPVRPLMPQP